MGGAGILGVPGLEREINQKRVREARGKLGRMDAGGQMRPFVRVWCDL